MRMVFTEHITHHTGGFFVGFIVFQPHFVHRIQHAAVYGFQAVAHVRQGAADDNAHRVINVIRTHFARDVALLDIAEQVHVLGLRLVQIFFAHAKNLLLRINRFAPERGLSTPRRTGLNVQVLYFQGVGLDEVAARLHAVAHQHGERLFRVGGVVDFNLD